MYAPLLALFIQISNCSTMELSNRNSSYSYTIDKISRNN